MAELTPFLCVADGPAAIDWYVEVLGAEVTYEPIMMPDGTARPRRAGSRTARAG